MPKIKAKPSLKTDPQRPSTWVRYRKGLCDGCWSGCCTLPVEASVQDLIRLGLCTSDEAASGLKALAKRLTRERWIQRFDARSQIFVLAQRHGRDCIFLDTKRLCTVYDRRPSVCRRFPSEIGPRPGFCPHSPKKP